MTRHRTLIVGLGSDFGDDRLGWVAVQRLQDRLPNIATIALRSPADLFDRLTDVDHLHVMDACQGAGPPGTVFRRDWPSADVSQIAFGGTHDISLPAALEIAQQLSLLPARVTIWGIEMSTTEWVSQVPLTPLVASAVDDLVTQLIRVIATAAMSDAEVHAHHA